MKITLDNTEKDLLLNAVKHIVAVSFSKPLEDVSNMDISIVIAGIFQKLQSQQTDAHESFYNMLTGYCLATGLGEYVAKASPREVYLQIIEITKIEEPDVDNVVLQ